MKTIGVKSLLQIEKIIRVEEIVGIQNKAKQTVKFTRMPKSDDDVAFTTVYVRVKWIDF